MFVFDKGHEQAFSTPQPENIRFGFKSVAPAATNLVGYALLLTNE